MALTPVPQFQVIQAFKIIIPKPSENVSLCIGDTISLGGSGITMQAAHPLFITQRHDAFEMNFLIDLFPKPYHAQTKCPRSIGDDRTGVQDFFHEYSLLTRVQERRLPCWLTSIPLSDLLW